MLNLEDIGTLHVGPSEMIANQERLNLRADRVTSQYLLANTYQPIPLECRALIATLINLSANLVRPKDVKTIGMLKIVFTTVRE